MSRQGMFNLTWLRKMIQLKANNRSERIEKPQMVANLENLPKKKPKWGFHPQVIMVC